MARDVPHWTPERRRTARVELRLLPGTTAYAAEAGALVLRELGEGGLLVEGGAPMRPGVERALTLAIDGQTPLAVRARVVYSRASTVLDAEHAVRYVTALAFADLDAQARAAVRAMIDGCAPSARTQE